MSQSLKGKSIDRLMPAFKTKETQENYLIKLRMFLEFSKIEPDALVTLVKKNPRKAEDLVTSYILERKGKVSGSTIHNFKMALKLFLSMNDCDKLNWVRIGKIMPSAKKHGSDRAPSADELKKILDNCDLRMKCIVLTLLSSGVRIGAFDWLKWRDLEPVKSANYEFAKLTVYRGENEQYYTFVTPECYKYLLEYRALREQAGEKVEGDSPLVRNDWGTYKGAVDPAKAVAVTSKTLRDQLGRLYKRIGLRTTAKVGLRHEFQQVHGFRKFFKSITEQHMKSIYIELLMGHSTGVSDSYMKPSYQDMIDEYCKALPALTIIERKESTKEDIKQSFKREILLQIAGYKEEEVDKMDLASIKDEDFQKMVRDKLLGAMTNNGNRQKVVPADQVRELIPQGWEYVAQLPTGEAIVKLPF